MKMFCFLLSLREACRRWQRRRDPGALPPLPMAHADCARFGGRRPVLSSLPASIHHDLHAVLRLDLGVLVEAGMPRRRSAGRSTPVMRWASDSTVSPGCTVMTLMRRGRAAWISSSVRRRNELTVSRALRSLSVLRCLAAKMKR